MAHSQLGKQYTSAEQFIFIAAQMKQFSENNLMVAGATRISELSGPDVIAHCNDDLEPGPDDNTPTNDCDYILYQFRDGSIIWYVRGPAGKDYLQLRGLYKGVFRHSKYVAAGDQVVQDWSPEGNIYPKIWDMTIIDLGLTVRATNCLTSDDIKYVGELIRWNKEEVAKIPNLGPVSLKDIERGLAEHGLKLGTNIGGWEAKERL